MHQSLHYIDPAGRLNSYQQVCCYSFDLLCYCVSESFFIVVNVHEGYLEGLNCQQGWFEKLWSTGCSSFAKLQCAYSVLMATK
jgi:hypothetical protein